MKIRTNNADVKRDLDRLVAKPVRGIEVFCIAIWKDYKAYRVHVADNAMDLYQVVKGLSSETAEITFS